MSKKAKRGKGCHDRNTNWPLILTVAGTGFVALRELILNEVFNLAFTTKKSLLGKILFKEPLFFVPKEHIHWMTDQTEADGMEIVHLKSFDGLDLVGHYFHCENPKRVILMMHGWRGRWKGDFGQIGRYLHAMECDCLIVEERAQGESEGQYMTFGVLESRDCVDWAQYLTTRTNLPIYLYGVSMGGATVAIASGNSRLPKQVVGVIDDCGYTSPRAILQKVAKSMNPILPLFIPTINRRCRTKAGWGMEDDSAVASLARCKVPVFFAHGEADAFVPLSMAYENYEACASEKYLFTSKEANHGESFVLEHDRYLKELWEFFGWDQVAIPKLDE